MSYNSQVETFVVGDLVRFTGYEVDNPPLAHRIGIVLEVEAWSDPGSPERNVGVSVDVLWPDGSINTCQDDELMWISSGA